MKPDRNRAARRVASERPDGRSLSVVIPTYRREQVLIETVNYIQKLTPGPAEILLIDQTPEHEPATARALTTLEGRGAIRLVRLKTPSITHAMNVGLKEARGRIVLFLDDDIIPHPNLIAAHLDAHAAGHNVVAGQVLQPGEEPAAEDGAGGIRFNSTRERFVDEVIGCNFSVKRELAIRLGGFDENFVHVAYRFEAEFAGRAISAGEKILFCPRASIRHLKAQRGGTRAYGHHLTTLRPSHAVGAYYYFLRSKVAPGRLAGIVRRPALAVRTKHHLTKPWWIPVTLAAELAGLAWALFLFAGGPRLIRDAEGAGGGDE